MNVSPNVNLERIEEADLKFQSQLNKCLNEKRRRQCELGYLDELAGLISASASDMCSPPIKPDKCAILQETVNQIRRIKLEEENISTNDLQQSEVSSSKPNILANDILGPLLLEALDGFLFMVNTDGKIEFVSENIRSFLNYSQESLIDSSIYSIIHVGDHTRFISNLLPMSIGNGFGWNPESVAGKSKSFNCRFLVKPLEDHEETMEEKQTRVSQYKTMQIAAVLLPSANDKTDNSELDSDAPSHLVCVARRIAPNEKNSSSTVEQFTTRLDLYGKIVTIDTNGISAIYSQYLNKDLVGRKFSELCHPNDLSKLNQHLKETFHLGSNTSGVYRLRIAQDKYANVQTKSTRFSSNSMANEEDHIVATHSIIRDSEQLIMDGSTAITQRNNPSPICGTVTPSLNGNSYSFSSLSPKELTLNDIEFGDFPSSWDLGSSDEATSIPVSLGGTTTLTSTNSSAISSSQRALAGSAFSPELLSSRGSPQSHSPAQLSSTNSPVTGRATTPYTNSFGFSPIQTQSVSRTTSPSPTLGNSSSSNNKKDTSSELSNLSPIDEIISDSQDAAANVKLRNLLTHGIGEADSSISKNSDVDKMDLDVNDRLSYSSRLSADGNENIMLRDLLNREDNDYNDNDIDNKSIHGDVHMAINVEPCSADMQQRKLLNNGNNMLRKLLNNDDEDNYRRASQEPLIQQLLKTEAKAVENNLMTLNKNGNGFANSIVDNGVPVTKRKSPTSLGEEPLLKRQNTQNIQHAHLAGQNPMLASMLAQTPRTGPSVPTSVANAIVSQLPQDRLPKNLEKKLVHTPYTAASTSSPNNNQYSFNHVSGTTTRSLLATSLQQEVVTSDSRGHVTLAPHNNVNFVQQGFLNKMLPNIDPNQIGNGITFAQNIQQQSNVQSNVNLMFTDLTGESNVANINSNFNINFNKIGQNADPLLSAIFEQVWSMEQEIIGDAASPDDIALCKFLEELPDPPPPPVASPRPPTAQEVSEKLAITAIQRQLMNIDPPRTHFSQPVTVPMVPNQPQMSPNSFPQVNNHYQVAPPAYTSSAVAQRTRGPALHAMQAGALQQQIPQQNSQRHLLPQYNLNSINMADLSPQMKRNIAEKRKLYMHSQQRRLLQQKQQLLNRQQPMQETLQITGNNPFPDNMSDLMNNTVAPNVTLQRTANIAESQLSPRYSAMAQMSNSTAGPPPSPQQLSPGQRQQPYSPLSQQSYQNNYPQAHLSPHISPQPGTNQAWVQRQQNQVNLQQQNPMLNAQLSQGSYNAPVQPRFPNQQQAPRQMVRSMPSPGSRNSPFSNPPDSPFHPPSPGVALYQQQQPTPVPQQQPQQRLQRAVSLQSGVNSPRALQAGYGGNDLLLSPQPSPGSYNNPPVSNFNSTSSSIGFNSEPFGYDQQVFSNTLDRNRNTGSAMTSEYVRQELRAKVGARTQQQHQSHQQQHLMQPQASVAPTSSHQSLSQADFDALGFPLDLPSDGQPTSPSLYSASLLGGGDNQPPCNSPRYQTEDVRPAEPKKSLLQQLLSEPP